jgi:hypothetical protein
MRVTSEPELELPDDDDVSESSIPIKAATSVKIAAESESPSVGAVGDGCPEPKPRDSKPESEELIASKPESSCRLGVPATPSLRVYLNGAALVNRTLCRKIRPTRVRLETDKSWNMMQEGAGQCL